MLVKEFHPEIQVKFYVHTCQNIAPTYLSRPDQLLTMFS
jgi:hypothetical protein